MISIEEFLTTIRKGEIPLVPPIGTSINGFNFDNDAWDSCYRARDECIKAGMWTIVYDDWIKELALWIGNRTCLEIIAGAGWIAKALSAHGIDIVATDDYSWEKGSHNNHNILRKYQYSIEELEASEAVEKYQDIDILICSWPYMDNEFTNACKYWQGKPIVYIGEGESGCTADDEFFQGFEEDESAPEIQLMCWPGLHDHIQIGTWEKGGD